MSIADKLLGRESLKRRINVLEERIENLQEEKKRLKEKTEKESKRAKEAVAEKQDLDEKINRQQDKIDSLKGRVNREEMVKDVVENKKEKYKLNQEGLISLLSKLSSIESDREDLFSIYLPPGMSLGKLDREGSLRSEMRLNQLQKIKDLDSNTGKVMFYSEGLIELLFKPPLPIDKEMWDKGEEFIVEPLKKQMENEDIGLIFLSAGGSGVSYFGEESKAVKSEIKGKHKKGGFSQDRFSRLRDEQVEKHLDDVEKAIDELWESAPKYIVFSGSSKLVKKFEDRKISCLSEAKTFEKPLDFSKVTSKKDMEKIADSFWNTYIVRF